MDAAARPLDTTSPRTVAVVPIGTARADLVEWLARELESEFRCLRCVVERPFAARDELAAPDGRYPSDALLDDLTDWVGRIAGSAHWALGVTDLDLAVPDRPWIFGHATVGGCCAVVSLARLREPGDARNGEHLAILRTRLLKESVHELGHVAGLAHCPNPACVMVRSADLRATDAKPSTFCEACRRALRERPTGQA